MRSLPFHLTIFIFFLCALPAFAQADSSSKGLEAFQKFRNSSQPFSDSLSKYQYECLKQHLLTSLAQERYFQKQYDFYYAESLKHRFDTFQWQQQSGKIIFWVVILIVFIALLFAAIQFRISMTQSKIAQLKEGINKPGAGTGEEVHTVELSLKGVKVNSSVLGVVILVISLAFLYLYLVFVYPINTLKVDEFTAPSNEVTK